APRPQAERARADAAGRRGVVLEPRHRDHRAVVRPGRDPAPRTRRPHPEPRRLGGARSGTLAARARVPLSGRGRRRGAQRVSGARRIAGLALWAAVALACASAPARAGEPPTRTMTLLTVCPT